MNDLYFLRVFLSLTTKYIHLFHYLFSKSTRDYPKHPLPLCAATFTFPSSILLVQEFSDCTFLTLRYLVIFRLLYRSFFRGTSNAVWYFRLIQQNITVKTVWWQFDFKHIRLLLCTGSPQLTTGHVTELLQPVFEITMAPNSHGDVITFWTLGNHLYGHLLLVSGKRCPLWEIDLHNNPTFA